MGNALFRNGVLRDCGQEERSAPGSGPRDLDWFLPDWVLGDSSQEERSASRSRLRGVRVTQSSPGR